MEKVIIIGSGPAGYAAAIYAARAQLKPLVFAGQQLGGQVAISSEIGNYPGFPEDINGAELAQLMQRQAERFDARIEMDIVTGVDLSTRPFQGRDLWRRARDSGADRGQWRFAPQAGRSWRGGVFGTGCVLLCHV